MSSQEDTIEKGTVCYKNDECKHEYCIEEKKEKCEYPLVSIDDFYSLVDNSARKEIKLSGSFPDRVDFTVHDHWSSHWLLCSSRSRIIRDSSIWFGVSAYRYRITLDDVSSVVQDTI